MTRWTRLNEPWGFCSCTPHFDGQQFKIFELLFSYQFIQLAVCVDVDEDKAPYQGSEIASPPQHSEMEPNSLLSLTSARIIGGKLTSGTGSFLSGPLPILTALFWRTGTECLRQY
jgi:hypothetical protein